MAAVEISRLKAQINAITHLINNRDDFIHGLVGIIELYSNRAPQLGDWIPMETLIPTYNLSPIVMHFLESEISILARNNPDNAFEIANQLWGKNYFELKLLAITMISSLPVMQSKVIMQTLKTWIDTEEDKVITRTILKKVSALLQVKKLNEWILVIKTWLESDDIEKQRIGIYAIQCLIKNGTYKNMPRIFKTIEPLIKNPPVPLQRELQDVLYDLKEMSETETASFLRSIIQSTKNSDTYLLIRRSITGFSNDTQADLRKLIENQ
jgi:hypothetical protein